MAFKSDAIQSARNATLATDLQPTSSSTARPWKAHKSRRMLRGCGGSQPRQPTPSRDVNPHDQLHPAIVETKALVDRLPGADLFNEGAQPLNEAVIKKRRYCAFDTRGQDCVSKVTASGRSEPKDSRTSIRAYERKWC